MPPDIVNSIIKLYVRNALSFGETSTTYKNNSLTPPILEISTSPVYVKPKERQRRICVKKICLYINNTHRHQEQHKHDNLPPAIEIETNQWDDVGGQKCKVLVIYIFQLRYLEGDISSTLKFKIETKIRNDAIH